MFWWGEVKYYRVKSFKDGIEDPILTTDGRDD